MKLSVTLLAAICCSSLVACSSSSSSGGAANPNADLQGNWVSQNCFPDEEDSTGLELKVNGNNFEFSEIDYQDTNACDNTAYVSTNQFGTITVSGEVTTTADGDAKHIDVVYTRATLTAGQEWIDRATAQGSSLEAAAAANGIPDINNVELSVVRDDTEVFDIYLVEGNLLILGDRGGSFTGSSPALRPVQLDRTSNILVKQ